MSEIEYKKVIGAYYRISKNTHNKSTDESLSITNQRALIKDYVRKDDMLNKLEYKEYIDDGYSGKNMQRIGINNLLSDISIGKIHVVIVKDFSRFSRDYLMMGEMLEDLVFDKGIRFIAINDYYDSEYNSREITTVNEAFKNIIYDYYSVENSYKIKKGLDKSRENGRYIASKSLYGYRNINNKLVIEDKEANIIRYIYHLYIKGIKVKEILKNVEKKYENIKWSTSKIYRILKEEQYTGVMIYGKRKNAYVASKKRIVCDKNQWKRVHNHHEAIINRELYEKVRRKMEGNQ